jgi:hypothetical protein
VDDGEGLLAGRRVGEMGVALGELRGGKCRGIRAGLIGVLFMLDWTLESLPLVRARVRACVRVRVRWIGSP